MIDYKGAKVRKNSETDTLFRDLFLFYALFLVCKGKDAYLCPEKELTLVRDCSSYGQVNLKTFILISLKSQTL